MRPYIYVTTDEELRAAVDKLACAPRLALDTESNNQHAYRERVCLLQLSSAQHDYILDLLALTDLDGVGALLADDQIEIVVHAAENDVTALKRDFGFHFANLFDTMAAARICGEKNVGLSALVEKFFGVQLDKSHQLDNWGARPLAEASLRYAQADTHYLLPLRQRLADELHQRNRWQHAQEVFADLCLLMPSETRFDPEGYWRIAQPVQLSPRQTAVLRELYLMRDAIAQAQDMPPFRILTDKVLAALARKAPQTPQEMVSLSDLPLPILVQYGGEMLAAVQRGLNAPLPTPPPTSPPADPAVVERYTSLIEWRREQSRANGIDGDVIISRSTLWEIARIAPSDLDDLRALNGMGDARISSYGESILARLRQHRK